MPQMSPVLELSLEPRCTQGALVTHLGSSAWRLEIPAGPAGQYRLAQVDDYSSLPRSRLPWQAPVRFSLRARLSAADLPGTWGFGLWNDPFSFSIGLGGMARRYPTLPRAAWFFYASPQNYLSFRDDLPANSFLAATFQARQIPSPLVALGSPLLGLALLPPMGKLLRQVVRRMVPQGAGLVDVDVTRWHTYALECLPCEVHFRVDSELVFSTPAAPGGRLGLVLWIDNQFAAWQPSGRLRYGFLANPMPAWLEIADFEIKD